MSLRLRLALWYGGLTGVLVVFVCAYSYAVHSRTHYEELDGMMRRTTAHVAEEMMAVTPQDHPDVLGASQYLGTAMRIFDAEGRVTRQSPAAGAAPQFDPRVVHLLRSPPAYPSIAAWVPSLHDMDLDDAAFTTLPDDHGQRWRVFVARIAAGDSPWLAAIQPLATLDQSVRRFGQLMLLMAATGAILTFGAGWLLASRALRPVTVLTDEARTIARSQEFARRVPVEHPEDELGRLAVAFNEMLGRLQTAYAAEQRFVSDASHELRAPLTVLQANLDILRRAPSLAPNERQHALAEAGIETERLARLVADLLALARADTGQPIRREPVELDSLLMDVIGQARHLTRGQRLEVGALEPMHIQGDSDRLKQLLLILVDNAVKYTPASGRIVLSLQREGRSARLAVRDTGIGIPPAALPHVFERFFRADPARARDPGGTGLGLPIARWIAVQHGGDVVLSASPGGGTMAVVTLPG